MTTLLDITHAALVPPDVPGWMDFSALYADMVSSAPHGAAFVEIGSWLGKSAITMARLIQQSGKSISFTCVDTFQGSPGDPEYFAATVSACGGSVRSAFEANLRRYGVHERVRILELPSVEAAATFADASLDFVFIDADHAFESVCADIRAWLPKVRPGGVLAGHDWGYMGVADAVQACLPFDEILVTSPVQTAWLWQKPAAGA